MNSLNKKIKKVLKVSKTKKNKAEKLSDIVFYKNYMDTYEDEKGKYSLITDSVLIQYFIETSKIISIINKNGKKNGN